MRHCKNPGCSKSMEGKNADAKFCGSRCKDHYHNKFNPRGKYAHLKDKQTSINDDGPEGWDGHKDLL